MNITLVQRLQQLEQDNADLHLRVEASEKRSNRERLRLRLQGGLAFFAFIAAVFVSPGNRAAIAQGAGVTLASLDARLSIVEGKTQFQSADSTAKSTTFSACNVIVHNGGGVTSAVVKNAAGQGLGNLLIGYNQTGARAAPGDICTGSHNLILGDSVNYSSYGGIATGLYSTISAPYASVTGGYSNTASGQYASVTGGWGNTASGQLSSVTGGTSNTASGNYASVTGGNQSTANGNWANISGGQYCTASGQCASVSGGQSNLANGNCSSVSGGVYNYEYNTLGWMGGNYHTP